MLSWEAKMICFDSYSLLWFKFGSGILDMFRAEEIELEAAIMLKIEQGGRRMC